MSSIATRSPEDVKNWFPVWMKRQFREVGGVRYISVDIVEQLFETSCKFMRRDPHLVKSNIRPYIDQLLSDNKNESFTDTVQNGNKTNSVVYISELLFYRCVEYAVNVHNFQLAQPNPAFDTHQQDTLVWWKTGL